MCDSVMSDQVNSFIFQGDPGPSGPTGSIGYQGPSVSIFLNLSI